MTIFVDLGTNTVWAGARREKVEPQLAEFIYVLVRSVGRSMSFDTLWDQVHGHYAETGETSTGNWAKVRASQSRKILKALEVDATIETTYGFGYRLVFGETDPVDEFIVRCLKRRDDVEKFLEGGRRR